MVTRICLNKGSIARGKVLKNKQAFKSHSSYFTGRSMHSQPTKTDLQWINHCLHDPSLGACRSKGMTISIWLALQSVSKTNIRYICNSGDAGDSEVSAILDGHGWSIFTHGALLGASVSMEDYDWSLILDSKTYKLSE